MSLILGIVKGAFDEANHVYGGAGLRLYPSPKIFIALLYFIKYNTLFPAKTSFKE